jgi:hypothetical protein
MYDGRPAVGQLADGGDPLLEQLKRAHSSMHVGEDSDEVGELQRGSRSKGEY